MTARSIQRRVSAMGSSIAVALPSCGSGFSRELFGSGRESSRLKPLPQACRSKRSVAEVVELKRQLEFLAAQQRHHRLQVVALLAGDAQLVAFDLAVDLELGVLDRALDLLRQLALDALAHGDLQIGSAHA